MYKKYVKRLFDIVFSALFLIVLSLLFFIVAIITYIELGSPIIFKQYRAGENTKEFLIYKFRTMNFDVNAKRETRMTKVTKIIDRYRLNELPQLINVLKGDMSIVGPRPLWKVNLNEERYKVKPGITGLAQINGGRHILNSKKLEYDLIYNNNLSFLLDLKIVLKTPLSILKDLKK